jgi:hypothetical protein
MTIARKVFSAGAVGALSVILAGCMGDGGGGSPSRPSQSGVEGSWIDAQGTGLSTLAGGSFSTVATDTGQKLAQGSYTLTNPTSVQIVGTSLIRQGQPISFNCLLISSSQLNCTSAQGQQFVLTRRA